MVSIIVQKENIKLYYSEVQEVIYGLTQAIGYLLGENEKESSRSILLQITKLQRIKADLKNQIGI